MDFFFPTPYIWKLIDSCAHLICVWIKEPRAQCSFILECLFGIPFHSVMLTNSNILALLLEKQPFKKECFSKALCHSSSFLGLCCYSLACCCAGGEEVREGGGGNPFCSAYCLLSPFPLTQNRLYTVYRAVREKEGWEGGRGENKVPSGVIRRQTCIHSPIRDLM